MDAAELEKNAARAGALLAVLANPHRLMVLCKLLEGEHSVGALAQGVNLGQSALSQHLARLREQGLVATRRDAQTIYYRLASREARAILATLYELYCAPAAADIGADS